MNLLSQNWWWIVLIVGVLLLLGRRGHHGLGSSEHSDSEHATHPTAASEARTSERARRRHGGC